MITSVRRFGGAQFSEEGKMTNDERRATEVLREEIIARKVKLAERYFRADRASANLYDLFECVKLAGFELQKGEG